ncbi:hypothetical protein FRB95_013814 [Tulasnella sp. JGI-2019a]|nr:hypothetical protein FRB95_013814 [Tulasnella sp. JGI-2019a]
MDYESEEAISHSFGELPPAEACPKPPGAPQETQIVGSQPINLDYESEEAVNHSFRELRPAKVDPEAFGVLEEQIAGSQRIGLGPKVPSAIPPRGPVCRAHSSPLKLHLCLLGTQ